MSTPAQRLAGLRRDQEEQGLRRGDQHVRRGAGERPSLRRGGVARADAHPHVRDRRAQACRRLADAGQGRAQVALDVHGQRLQRRDVQHPAAPPGFARSGLDPQPVQRPQEGGQRLAGPGRGHDQGVLTAADGRPRAGLRRRGLGERAREPVTGRGREPAQRVAHPAIVPAIADSALVRSGLLVGRPAAGARRAVRRAARVVRSCCGAAQRVLGADGGRVRGGVRPHPGPGLVMSSLGEQTAQQALAGSEDARTVWWAVCDAMDVPPERRWGQDQQARRAR